MDDEHVQRHYEPLIEAGRPGHEVADWADAAAQQLRFKTLADHVDLAGRSLLDVGCGTGDLWAFLLDRKIGVTYLGIDLIEKMVAEARRRHPQAAFECASIFEAGALEGRQFDVVFASGVFNLDTSDNRQRLPEAVKRLLAPARDTVVFNLLHARTANRYPDCIYWDPAEVATILKRLNCDWHIVDDYLPNDFTIIVRAS